MQQQFSHDLLYTFTPFYITKFRGGHKSGGARATVASPSLAPLIISMYVPTWDMNTLAFYLSLTHAWLRRDHNL